MYIHTCTYIHTFPPPPPVSTSLVQHCLAGLAEQLGHIIVIIVVVVVVVAVVVEHILCRGLPICPIFVFLPTYGCSGVRTPRRDPV